MAIKMPAQFSVGLLVLSLSALSIAASPVHTAMPIGRYLTVAVKPQPPQQHVLQQRIHVRFPQNSLTLQQAVHFLLQFTGYRLVDLKMLSAPARAMLQQPLPLIDRTLGPLTCLQALNTLAGPAFVVLVDPAHRRVAFQLRAAYRALY